jgi:hypothetical protein
VARGVSRTTASAAYVVAEMAAVVVTVLAVVGHASMTVAVVIDLAVALAVLGAASRVGGLRASPEASQ